jgi:hypothetical protein
MCEKSFSDVEQEIVDRFVEFQQALIGNDLEKLNEIISDGCKLDYISGKSQSKDEFLAEIEDGTLNYSMFDTFEPAILFDDENTASLIAKVRLTAEINGRELRWISNSVVSFEKSGGNWHIGGWDN